MRINCHAHCFNVRTILTPASLEIIQRRVGAEIRPEDAARFLLEIANLRRAVDGSAANDDPHQELAKIFDGMQRFWRQSHHVRAVGRWVVAHLSAIGMLGDTTRTLTVEWSEDGAANALVIAGS